MKNVQKSVFTLALIMMSSIQAVSWPTMPDMPEIPEMNMRNGAIALGAATIGITAYTCRKSIKNAACSAAQVTKCGINAVKNLVINNKGKTAAVIGLAAVTLIACKYRSNNVESLDDTKDLSDHNDNGNVGGDDADEQDGTGQGGTAVGVDKSLGGADQGGDVDTAVQGDTSAVKEETSVVLPHTIPTPIAQAGKDLVNFVKWVYNNPKEAGESTLEAGQSILKTVADGMANINSTEN